MIAKLVARSQINIPEDAAEKIGMSVGDMWNISVHGKKIILVPISEKPWSAGDIWEAEELIPTSLVKAAGLEDWYKDGFTYPHITPPQSGLPAEERLSIVDSLIGSIDDPTFVEPPEVETPDAPRNWELMDL